MSYAQLYYADEEGDMLGGEEFRNSWGGSAFIWDMLCKRYDVKAAGEYPSPFDAWELLWKRTKELPLQPWEHNVLMLTYDRMIIRREDMALLAESLVRFHEAHHVEGRVDHTKAMAEAIRNNLDSHGVGLYGTSVSDNLWNVRNPALQQGIEEVDWEERPYNVKTDDEHEVAELRSLE